MKKITNIIYPAIAVCAFACFVLAPQAQAVVPAPDGGYPGGNTAEGQAALLSLTTGGYDTAVGYLSLRSNTGNSFNTAVGAGALLANGGPVADENTATGAGALLSNTAGFNNTATGAFALFSNIAGIKNTAVGHSALFGNHGGSEDTAVGDGSLQSNSAGNNNTAIGSGALPLNTIGLNNTAVGRTALANSTGSYNIGLGADAGINVTTAVNVICIGAAGNNVDNSCYIGNIFGATSSGGVAVYVNTNGRLGTMTSSRRFKDEIKPMEQASEVLFSLKPVSFCYKKEIDPARKAQFGLVAEDVEKVNPDLVVRDKGGKPYSVRYDQVNAMLLNEFLKEHRKVEEQQATISELKSTVARQQKRFVQQDNQIAALAAGLQKVTAQIETKRAQPQLVNAP